MRRLWTRTMVTAALVAVALAPVNPTRAGAGAGAGADARTAAAASGGGYWLLAADGGVFSFGSAAFHGAVPNRGADIAGMAATPSGNGYWVADDDGDVFPVGDAPDFGSRATETDDIAAFSARPQGDGYWMATRTGAVEAYGSAPNLGGVVVKRSHRIVAMTPTRSGNGYWLGALDGGVFTFGDAAFHGSMGGARLNQPTVGMAATPSGAGYWLVASDGGIFAFGDARFYGSMGGTKLNQPIVAMAATPSGAGYWLVASDGGIFAFGDAAFYGSMGGTRLNQPIVGMAAHVGGTGGTGGTGGGGDLINAVTGTLPALPGVLTPPVTIPNLPLPIPPDPIVPDPVLPGQPVTTFVAAGDIVGCSASGDEATAKVIDGVVASDPTTVVATLGDNVYDSGSASEFSSCYDPSWGRFRTRTKPAPGNHDYKTSGASGYFNYFGAVAGDRSKGYYSYDIGGWHFVVLNSNCSEVGGCGAGSPQEQWLRADLAASAARCTVAYWHHPRFNSGHYGNDGKSAAFWDVLYQYGAELVLNGHEHLYERLGPQTPGGKADPAFGVREFIVGTGGRSQYAFGTTQPNSEARKTGTYGVLKLSLGTDGYSWQFLPIAGKTFTDSGSGACHGRPGV